MVMKKQPGNAGPSHSEVPKMLFSPIRIGELELKNRIVMPAMLLGEGKGADELGARVFYVERAQGGAGAITTGGIEVDALTSEGPAFGRSGSLDDFLKALPVLTEEVHAAGARIGAQLMIVMPPPWSILEDIVANRTTLYGKVNKIIMTGPPPGSDAALPEDKKPFDEMSLDDIEAVKAKTALAAAGAKAAGFDFIDFHGSHTHFQLLLQAFSPLGNHRQDAYGGDITGRMRFGLECMAAVRAAVGKGYPISYRLPAIEGEPGGITLEDAKAYAVELEKIVDVINVSVGPGYIPFPLPKEPMGAYAHLAEAIKRCVSIPVIAVGKINTPEVAESILSTGKADMVAIGRQLIADPFWPVKVAEGRSSEIVSCDSCCTCLGTVGHVDVKPGSPMCRRNPRAGREAG